jgi:hypothetical protein
MLRKSPRKRLRIQDDDKITMTTKRRAWGC